MERIDRRRRELQRKRMKQRLMIIGGMGLAAGLILGGIVGGAGKRSLKKELKEMTTKYEAQSQEVVSLQEAVNTGSTSGSDSVANANLPWNLVLVNPWNEMAEGYEPPELVEIEPDQEVDSRIAEDLKKMLADANAQGLSPFICSAYRSVERQESLFDSGFQKRVNSGLGYYEAYLKTASVIAVPGTSEHALGLAVDIVSNDYTNLDEGQEETEEFKWLSENCHKYGFILRYPNGTTDITGIIYEPWHFRYVGEEIATEIAELGVTLEEYLENHYNK